VPRTAELIESDSGPGKTVTDYNSRSGKYSYQSGFHLISGITPIKGNELPIIQLNLIFVRRHWLQIVILLAKKTLPHIIFFSNNELHKTLTTAQPSSMLFKTRKPLYNATFTTIVL